MKPEPLISVIIPTFRALGCLKLAVSEFLKEPRCEVVVGLDGDNKAYRAFLDSQPVVLSATRRRQGACTATNLAASRARGRYLLLCNDDMVPAPGWCDAMLRLAGPNEVVSGTCWEPGNVPVPPPHQVRDFGTEPSSFRMDEFFEEAAREAEGTEPGINYPFLISRQLWVRVGGLDSRFEPGSASDPDLFIRLTLLHPRPKMVRAKGAVFYHFASRSSIFAGGRLSLSWKLHRRHGRAMFRHKWGRMWGHRFGEVPEVEGWRSLAPRPEPAFRGRLWRRLWFGNPGRHEAESCGHGVAGGRRGLESVAIFIWGGLGNAVMALPMVNAARKALGDENVTLFLPRTGWECLVRDRQRLRRLGNYKNIVSSAGCDAALPSLPYPRWRYGMASLFFGAKTRIGDVGLPNPLLNLMVDTKERGCHWVERNLAMLEGLGIAYAEAKFGIPVDEKSKATAIGFLKGYGLDDKGMLIGFHPGSGNPMRRWSSERFIELGRLLAGQGKHVVVFGGPGESDLAERVASGIGGKAASFCGSLQQALALISLCRSFVAADSGLAHCAAALEIPTLALMGPSDESMYRPYGPRVKVLTGKAECRPCYRPGRPIHCHHQRRICLDIGVEEALEGLRGLA